MSEDQQIAVRLVAALVAGGLVGLERSYHGRPAGFRTHALVCLGSALLMLVTVFETQWLGSLGATRVTIDPTRMAQGIMTGIGFLGAGVIMKDGLSVRGLTTAASIWLTAATGVLIGIGFYVPAALAVVLTLGTLSTFRWFEDKMPRQTYARFLVRCARDAVMPESELRALVNGLAFTIANLSYTTTDKGRFVEYGMMIRTLNPENLRRLAEALMGITTVLEFRISPTGD